MTTIQYRRHCGAVIGAAGLFLLSLPLFDSDLPTRIGRDTSFYAFFGVIGILHATAIVASLRDRRARRPIAVLSFIALAGVWSASTIILGLWSSSLWELLPSAVLHESARFVLLFGITSAIGSAGYWLLVRLFWLNSFRTADCLRTILLCVAATLASAILGPFFWTVAWWFAFSLSLYWCEIRRQPDQPLDGRLTLSSS